MARRRSARQQNTRAYKAFYRQAIQGKSRAASERRLRELGYDVGPSFSRRAWRQIQEGSSNPNVRRPGYRGPSESRPRLRRRPRPRPRPVERIRDLKTKFGGLQTRFLYAYDQQILCDDTIPPYEIKTILISFGDDDILTIPEMLLRGDRNVRLGIEENLLTGSDPELAGCQRPRVGAGSNFRRYS